MPRLSDFARMTVAQKMHVHLLYRSTLVSLADPTAARYLRDWSDDDLPPTAAPALPVLPMGRV